MIPNPIFNNMGEISHIDTNIICHIEDFQSIVDVCTKIVEFIWTLEFLCLRELDTFRDVVNQPVGRFQAFGDDFEVIDAGNVGKVVFNISDSAILGSGNPVVLLT